MNSSNIKNLINYAYEYLDLDKNDELYVRNRLLEACFMEEYDDTDESNLVDISNLDYPDSIINPILDDLIESGKVLESNREYYLCKIMDIISLRPSAIEAKFTKIAEESSVDAFKWLHSYSEHNSYIKLSDIRKNMGWIVNDEKGGLEITINLSKPEKSNSDVKKALSAAPKYPKCVICPENMGYAGHGTTRQNLRGHNMILGGDPWFWQFSPYAYFNEHGIAINASHTPMVVEEKNITNVLDFIDYVPEYFIGFNAALPIIGGSILAHDHYQGGRYTLPVFKSKDKYLFTAKTHPNVKISILNWYNNVIRLESTSRTEIEAVAQQIVRTWKSYDDVENNIIARTNVQHSSITCISRYDNKYIIDLILRNNVTSEEYPDGVYHAHPEYHNIKKEAIGLIEAGGMFILPARLKRQLAIVSDCLQANELNLDLLQEDMQVHKDMIQRLVDNHGIGLSEDKANNVIKLEIERICREILYNTAVYKDTEAGNNGFIKFMNSNDFKLV